MVGSWVKTPLFYSGELSRRLGCRVFLKLENLQPTQSFKCRGISTLIQEIVKEHGQSTHFYIASSGNAGYACASVASALGVRCTVCLPEQKSREMVDLLLNTGAQVIEKGRCYSESAEYASEIVKDDPDGILVKSYDDPRLWNGHSSLIHEVHEDLIDTPKAIFTSVGGGGLLGGILIGMEQVGWSGVPVFTLETENSSCFYHTMALNRLRQSGYVIPADAECVRDSKHKVDVVKRTPTSKASSLGASVPAAGVVKMALDRNGPVRCIIIPDEFAMETLLRFVDLHKFLVELACSTALSPAFNKELFQKCCPTIGENDSVIFVCCGGMKIGLEELIQMKERLKDMEPGTYRWACLDNEMLYLR